MHMNDDGKTASQIGKNGKMKGKEKVTYMCTSVCVCVCMCAIKCVWKRNLCKSE